MSNCLAHFRLEEHLKKNPAHRLTNLEAWHEEAERRIALRNAAGPRPRRTSPCSTSSSSSRSSRSPTPQRLSSSHFYGSRRHSNTPPTGPLLVGPLPTSGSSASQTVRVSMSPPSDSKLSSRSSAEKIKCKIAYSAIASLGRRLIKTLLHCRSRLPN